MKELVKHLMTSNNWVILDTETTGLGTDDEICQIGILAPSGTGLLDMFVKPTVPIPAEATAIHGITNDHVKNALTIADLEDTLHRLLVGKEIVVYNAPYDSRMLRQSFEPHYGDRTGPGLRLWRGYEPDIWGWVNDLKYTDVMEPYAKYYGEWNNYHANYKWQKLSNACKQQGVSVKDAHSAIGDCKMTLALIKAVYNGNQANK